MAADSSKNNPELEALYRKYERAPDSYVFAPLADAYRKAGKLDEAVEICRKGLRQHPEYPSGHVVEGKCHYDVGMLDEAEESFRKVLDLDGNNLVALKYLGMIHAGQGDLEQASQYFKHILALDPENREIKGMLDDLSEVQPPTADVESDTVIRVVPGGETDSISDEDFEGEPIELGRGGDASEEMTDEMATTTLADIYAAQGFTKKAARIYQEVLRGQPDNDEVRRKLEALEREPETVDPRPASRGAEEPPTKPEEPVAGDSRYGVAWESTEQDADDDRDRPWPRSFHGGAHPSDGPRLDEETADRSRVLDDNKSYDQFKRWLEKMKG